MFGHQDEPKNNDDVAGMSLPPSNDTQAVDVSPAGGAPITAPSVSLPPTDTAKASPDALLDIKQQALQQLTPLVGHLEQSPEERFRTTMMMIQASDNQGLIKNAYDAAQSITDEKVRAQALLDIVNEINYFTQHNK